MKEGAVGAIVENWLTQEKFHVLTAIEVRYWHGFEGKLNIRNLRL